jgi:hypothetical protein
VFLETSPATQFLFSDLNAYVQRATMTSKRSERALSSRNAKLGDQTGNLRYFLNNYASDLPGKSIPLHFIATFGAKENAK